MNKKILIVALAALSMCLGACNNQNEGGSNTDETSEINEEIYEVYRLYKASGGTMSYEEWLASIKGADGSSLLNGTSNPDASVGNNGDTYINTSTWDVFVKTGGNWTKVGNIMGSQGPEGPQGPQGPSGENGSSVLSGNGEPASELGNNGDLYIDLETWNVYKKGNGNWAFVGNIKGANGGEGAQGNQGEPGNNGSSVLTGEGEPSLNLGAVGDSYIDLSTWDFYIKAETGWVKKGNIKGKDGEDLTNNEYHTVTFDTKGAGSIPSQTILHGEKIQKPDDPSLSGYTFDGWSYQGEKWSFIGFVVTEDMLLEAEWTAIEYTATFLNNDGNILKTVSPVYYGQTLTYDGDTPIAANQQAHYSYTFSGWDKDLIVTGDMSFVAQYTTEYLPVTAKFYNENDVLLYETNVKEGEDPVFSGETPTKDDDEEFQYQFSNWYVVSESSEEIIFKPRFVKKTNGLVIENNIVKQYAGVLEEVIIPEKWNNVLITAIDPDAFSYNMTIKKVTLPRSMTVVSERAFVHAEMLETVVLPDTIIEMQSYCFSSCLALKNISIPDSVITFGTGVFNNCTSLENILLPEGLTSIPEAAFQSCSSLKGIVVPSSVQTIGKNAFNGCSALESADLGSGVKSIGQYAFKSTGLPYIVIPSTIQEMSGYVFQYDSNLFILAEPEIKPSSWSELWDDSDATVKWGFKSLKMKDGYLYAFCNVGGNKSSYLLDCVGDFNEFCPESKIDGYTLNDIRTSIFKKENIMNVSKLVINANIEKIPDRAFQSMTNITFASLTGKIQTIGQYAFLWNNSLKDVVISKTIKKFEWRAFYSCPQLTNVYYLGSQSDWDSIVFESENETIQGVNRFYYSETEPTESGNYWHYVEGVPTVW